MATRKTIMLDGKIEKKIRLIQANMLRDENRSVSFSKVLNLVLTEGIKKF